MDNSVRVSLDEIKVWRTMRRRNCDYAAASCLFKQHNAGGDILRQTQRRRDIEINTSRILSFPSLLGRTHRMGDCRQFSRSIRGKMSGTSNRDVGAICFGSFQNVVAVTTDRNNVEESAVLGV